MIIPEKLIGAAAVVISDVREIRVDFIISCGGDGLYSGKIMRSGIICEKTDKRETFKKALSDLFQLCYNEVGEDER